MHASSDRSENALGPVLRQAGGVSVPHGGHGVIANFGSAAGELAGCVSAVGLADCSQLTKLVLEGPPAQLQHLAERLTGSALAPGGAVLSGGAWWCAERPDRLLVVCDPRLTDRLLVVLRARAARRSAVHLTDRSTDFAALAVVGRRASAVLAELGVYGASGNPRHVPPLTAHAVTGAEVLWLLESDDKALALTAVADAPAVWHRIEQAGQRFGLCAVGHEALERYALIRRIASPL